MCYVATREIAVTSKQDIPGYSMDLSTNKRVYPHLYTILYKSSQKFYSKMPLLHPIQRRSENVYQIKIAVEFPILVEFLQLKSKTLCFALTVTR